MPSVKLNLASRKLGGKLDSAAAAVIQNYSHLSGDPAAFAAALNRPLNPCVWANPHRLTRDKLTALLLQEGIASEQVTWTPNALRLAVQSRPGLSWIYRAGLMQPQEEAALLSVRLLDPQPGERVLDLCASPGNKTAQIAFALDNRGTIIANDLKVGRLAPLHTTISRLGLMNVSTTAWDGTTYPSEIGGFDKILADVPCSGEGIIRKGAGKHKPVPYKFRRWLNKNQSGLLRRAINLCRPGGRIVYSTCTFAPEENEAIIDQILKEHSKDIRVISSEIPGLKFKPGLTKWKGQNYRNELSKSLRLWPHFSNTGGFFAIILERTDTQLNVIAPNTNPLTDHTGYEILHQFAHQFGLSSSTIARYQVTNGINQRRLIAKDHVPPANPAPIATGLALTRQKAASPKLSTQVALALGDRATRNFIELHRDEVDLYHSRQTIAVTPQRLQNCDETGHVIVRHQGFSLGIGNLRQERSNCLVDSLFPKKWG